MCPETGGGLKPIALDGLTAEQRYELEPANKLSADKLFERRCALMLLEQVLRRVRDEQAAAGRLDEFLAKGNRRRTQVSPGSVSG